MRLALAAIAAVIIVVGVGRAQLPPIDPAALLARAESDFDAGLGALESDPARAKVLFTRSAAAYAELAGPRGYQNARLLANLGNAYMLAGDAGRAVLWYRRAERIDPSDRAVRAGLAYARHRVGTQVEPSPGPADWLLAWRAVAAPSTVLRLGAGMWAAGWLALLPWRRFGMALRPAGAALICGAIVCFAAVLATEAGEGRSPAAVVISETTGRNGPDATAYAPTFDRPLAAGVELTILEVRGDWLRARLADGRETWLPASAIERI